MLITSPQKTNPPLADSPPQNKQTKPPVAPPKTAKLLPVWGAVWGGRAGGAAGGLRLGLRIGGSGGRAFQAPGRTHREHGHGGARSSRRARAGVGWFVAAVVKTVLGSHLGVGE